MADVESSNVVGYTTKSVEGGKFYLVGTQFNKTGDAAGAIDVNDLITLSSSIIPGEYDSDFVGAPEIQALNAAGTGYNKYYYISDATDDDDEPLGFNCWADIDGYQLKDSDKIAIGKGFWLKPSAAGTITVAGEVKAEANAVVNFPANQFFIMANPFPKDLSFADVTTTGVTPGEYDA